MAMRAIGRGAMASGLRSVMWLAAVCTLLTVCASTVRADPRSAVFSVEEVVLPSKTGALNSYLVAVIRFELEENEWPVAIERSDDGDVDQTAAFPEEAEATAQGLTALICDNRTISSTASSVDEVYGALVPIDESQRNIVLQSLASLLGNQKLSISHAILLDPSNQEGVDAQWLESCRLEFLSESAQTLRPVGRYRLANGKTLMGPYRIRHSTRIVSEDHDIQSITDAIESVQRSLCGDASYHRRNTSTSHPLMTVTEFLETKGWGFDSMVSPILSGFTGPLAKECGGAIGGSLGYSMTPTLGSMLEQGLGDIIPLTFSSELATAITKVLVPSLAETVTDNVPPRVASAMTAYLVFKLNDRISVNLAGRLTQTVGASVHQDVDHNVPKSVDSQVISVVGRMLTKALTHTVVPAVLHTVTHSPLVDYYCYYCFYNQQYCPYCVYSPIQTYYAMYYAGYYSTYYGDYFVSYFEDIVKLQKGVGGSELQRRYEATNAGREVSGNSDRLVLEADPQQK